MIIMNTNNKHYPTVLTIAGSDPSGGAGIQADIKAISATGSYAASAITAVTVQNTVGVTAVHDVPVGIVRGQISAVLGDVGADAVKIGMLSSSELVLAVKDALLSFRTSVPGVSNIVLDPVMVATSGDRLITEEAVEILSGSLAPWARVITPNIPEAEILAGCSITSGKDLPEVAAFLSSRLSSISGGKVSVLMKAGHLEDEMLVDYFFNAEEGHIVPLRAPRVDSRNTHGTGCTLSSAFASFLAQGFSLDEAAARAKQYVTEAISSGAAYSIGHGHGPVNHFWMMH